MTGEQYWVCLKLSSAPGSRRLVAKKTLQEAENEIKFRKTLDRANKMKVKVKYFVEVERP